MNKQNIVWKQYKKSVRSVEHAYTFIIVNSWQKKSFDKLTASCFPPVTFIPVTRGLLQNEPFCLLCETKKGRNDATINLFI
jgi:hypothetical protein